MTRPSFARPLARLAALALLTAVVLLGRPRTAATAPAERSARGLDLFLHAAHTASPGARLEVAVLALGFPTLATTVPLEGATIEASWDVETLELERTGGAPPPSVSARADARGRAVLQVPVPDGDPGKLGLLVAVRDAGKERIQRLEVERVRRDDIDLFIGDNQVVPGGVTTAWAMVRDLSTGAPRPGVRVEAQLIEGAIERHRALGVTDAGGTVAFRVPIPGSREPAIRWELTTRVVTHDPARAPRASVSLVARGETPGRPRLDARFDAASARPGAAAPWRVRLRDAADAPVPRAEVRVWSGPAGAKPPEDEEGWRKASVAVTSSLDGEVRGSLPTPGVVPAAGVDLKIVARASIGGAALRSEATVRVGVQRASITLEPERGSLVPGVEQRLFVRLRGEDDDPLAGTFRVAGDGLAATVTLDAHGEGEVAWRAPAGIGGFRGVGPCSGQLAAAVRLEAVDEAARSSLAGARLVGDDDRPLCVPVDREASLLVRVDPPIVRAGQPVRVTVRGAAGRGASVVVSTDDGGRSAAAWAPDGEAGTLVPTPADASGVVRVEVAVPRAEGPAAMASAAALVIPQVLARVDGTVVGGTARPGGKVVIEARVHDGKGKGLPGTVAVAVIDRWGGGSFGGLHDLDTRGGLCRRVGVGSERCAELLEGPPSLLGRERVAGVRIDPGPPGHDPGAAVRDEAKRTFRAVVHSLEGAVYEASNEPERLPDVRRRDGAGWAFNPELLTLATAAMDPQPVTPGGEPITLADLIAVDRQVTFDHVARRVTRLKLYQVLQAIHEHRRAEGLLDPDEPALREVDAMLRRLVRAGAVTDAMLTDPWGGTIAAVRTQARDGLPFLRPAPGWELRSPGPDGRLGSGDDVRDPFERVLDRGTPYADAVDEDRVVDARLDMRVADATVESWRAMLEEVTGTSLGGLSLSGVGEGGGGMGFGSGHGRLGGAHRSRASRSVPTGIGYWSGPRRTGPDGTLRLEVPLGDVETTWTIGLVAVPDGARPAFSGVDVVSTLPLSAAVDAGARWVEGDRVGIAVTVKNRTERDADTPLAVRVSGALALDGAAPAPRVRVPRQGSITVRVPARATRAGEGTVEVTTGDGATADRLVHAVEVVPAGEELILSRAAFVSGEEVALDEGLTRPGLRPRGAPALVLEHADAGVLRRALDAVEPGRLFGDADLADAADVGARVEAWATARLGEKDPMTVLARRTREEALARLVEVAGERKGHAHASSRRAARWSADPAIVAALGAKDTCPDPKAESTLPLEAAVDLLDAEPALDGGAMPPCWGSYVGTLLGRLQESDDPVALARAIVALAERRHRVEDVKALGRRLAELVRLQPSGAIALDGRSRGDRALVLAALMRVPPRILAADRARLLAWLLVQRDARGGFGHATATRAAVRALLAPEGRLDGAGATRAVVTMGDDERVVDVPRGRPARLAVAEGATTVAVEAPAPGLFARVERRFLRPWSTPAPGGDAPVSLEVRWPEPRVGDAAPVRVVVSHQGRGARLVDVRIPLPPGAHLAAPVDDVREVQGHLLWETPVREREVFVELPVRFDLGGRVTIPEATASDASGGSEPARAPARPLVVAPRAGGGG